MLSGYSAYIGYWSSSPGRGAVVAVAELGVGVVAAGSTSAKVAGSGLGRPWRLVAVASAACGRSPWLASLAVGAVGLL